jgi:hypothetical protein
MLYTNRTPGPVLAGTLHPRVIFTGNQGCAVARSQMNLAFIPDLSALAILIVLLLLLRRRHSQQQTDIWLLGLFITLIEAVAHTFYAPKGIPSAILHVIVVDCYLLAGLVFNWASGDYAISHRSRLLYMMVNGLPLLAINTLYGMHIYFVNTYLPFVA